MISVTRFWILTEAMAGYLNSLKRINNNPPFWSNP
jgi:hypothetical protein